VAAGHDIAVIEYHSTDDYSNVFGDYRLFYYNATYFPFPLIDGIIQPIWSSYNSYETAYEERKSLPTNYSINMDMLKDSLDFSVSVHLIKIGANIQNKVLHFHLMILLNLNSQYVFFLLQKNHLFHRAINFCLRL